MTIPSTLVIPDKPLSGADPESIVERNALRWIPGLPSVARNDEVRDDEPQLSELPTAFSRMPQASSPYFFFQSL